MPLRPAGLTPDSIDVGLASSSSPPPTQYDQWSDAHETLETDDERDVVEEAIQHEDDLTVRTDKIVPPDKLHDIEAPSSTSLNTPRPRELDANADATSVHSMPVVQVTEATSPTVPMTAHSTSSRIPSSPNTSLLPPSPGPQARRTRHRATLDLQSAFRILLSLIHRREHGPAPTSPLVKSSSRSSSPVPSRASTPPPRLPAPSLRDLGLHLSTNPPCSGAFLSPHYLLLCHAQGLDVLPLVSPPRVAFKSVVVMEHRGVLVAIAGRRDGVRVYALEEVKRAVEWRIDVEMRREQERARREEAKRIVSSPTNLGQPTGGRRGFAEKAMSEKGFPTPSSASGRSTGRRASVSIVPPVPPLGPAHTSSTRSPQTPRPAPSQPPAIPAPPGSPPAYTTSSPSRPREMPTVTINQSRPRATSLSEVLSGSLSRRHSLEPRAQLDIDAKADWASSDDEAINVVAAPSGSQALDERTSSMAATTPSLQSRPNRRSRPANLDLTLSRTNSTVQAAPPSPTPTLLSLQQALTLPAAAIGETNSVSNDGVDADGDADAEGDEDDADIDPSSPTTPTRERISLAEALMESRLPELPPVGSRNPQEPILMSDPRGSTSRTDADGRRSPWASDAHSTLTRRSTGDASARRRRRWSVLEGIFSHSPANSQSSIPSLPEGVQLNQNTEAVDPPAPSVRELSENQLTRSVSNRIATSPSSATIRPATTPRPSTSPVGSTPREGTTNFGSSSSPMPPLVAVPTPHSRFLPRIITNAFQSRRSDETPTLPRATEVELRRPSGVPIAPHAPAPKLEYVKLPGTRGAVLVKAVETAKKSFLAILCGENGEKVELFAGTYRTALGLSRTFILPDSPRSLELQLQGDDLVEVFLVFSQNVFGLEPATVRVREVRIGRAERRAARRRARETRADQQTPDADGDAANAGDDDTPVNVTILASSSPAADDTPASTPPLPAAQTNPADSPQPTAEGSNQAANSTDELVTLAAAQMSPYTTFQQLSFSPNFPLATIADEYIIPPTYLSFLEYRSAHEPDVNGSTNVDLSQVQFSPPGLPVPTPAPPSKWYYRDPKGVVHGPWKSTLMQAWYKDGLLPPDLPVRREEDSTYILLRDLRLQCVDPMHPFRSSPPLPVAAQPILIEDATKPLLSPISLLSQPRHFGPPALFYSSRGGHSTTIVDARGRSVLKGRFLWSSDDSDEYPQPSMRLGDVKRLEAFDVDDRAVLVAMRQGGLEVVDFGDALLRPADYSRTTYPHFHPPSSSINRRGPFVWRIGAPLSSHLSSSSLSSVGLISSKSIMTRKKPSIGPTKSPGKSDFSLSGDGDSLHMQDEVLFLGRKEDEMYLCERRSGSFRILRLSTDS
ncbi:hypothetical protein B0H21DRAFT_741790 [Amylocystis lapponica]|nr:hypothetical protein B0H21DRAFT_741790 [Amylocystis lapponica]